MDSLVQNYCIQNVQNSIFKSLLKNKEDLIRFYYDLTRRKVKSSETKDDFNSYSIFMGNEENVCFQVGNKYLIFLKSLNVWESGEILRFLCHMISMLCDYIQKNYDEIIIEKILSLPAVEAYLIYTGKEKVPDKVTLDDYLPDGMKSMINAEAKVVTFENAVGMVKEYIEFSQILTKFYIDHDRENERYRY